ncbi:hypothetical protein N7457_004828 [Penicillium paradoxum]|uniref:uncharacterized protein n=1 Tax=Penicillium paradoxum TaxID=176176 RepID=UPI002547C699|nr:uncharacterized protein N7457_004828 [Penicillium paradoxum]KAJ5783054.1 hypothetical protein N7457_004828 [Penicillium paradoxum]
MVLLIGLNFESEAPRGRTGRPDTPQSSSSFVTAFTSQDEDDMCNPAGSTSSDERVVPAVRVAAAPANERKARVPGKVTFQESRSQSVGHDPKRNAFASCTPLADRVPLTSRPPFSSRLAPPPLPSILKKSTVRSFSAPPSPPKMENIDKSPTEGGLNKPLPMSPTSESTPRTPAAVASAAPRTPGASSASRTPGAASASRTPGASSAPRTPSASSTSRTTGALMSSASRTSGASSAPRTPGAPSASRTSGASSASRTPGALMSSAPRTPGAAMSSAPRTPGAPSTSRTPSASSALPTPGAVVSSAPWAPGAVASSVSSASAASTKDGMHPHPQHAGIAGSTTPRRSSLTMSELPEAVKSLQQKYESDLERLEKKMEDIARLDKKLDDFAGWVQNQLGEQVMQHSELAQGHAELGSKHNQQGYNLAAAILNIKHELKHDIRDLRTDLDGLSTSYKELNEKVDICIAGLWDSTNEPFVAFQRRKNESVEKDLEILESEISHLKDDNRNLTRLLVRVRMGLTLLDPSNSLSYELVSPDALPPATPTGRERIAVVPTVPAGTSAPAGSGTTTSPGTTSGKQTSIPRRAKQSLAKKMSTAQLSGNKDGSKKQTGASPKNTAGSSDSKSKQSPGDKQDSSADGNKRRAGLFGTRRRRDDSVSSNSSGKGARSSLQGKEAEGIPPVPAIPQNLARGASDASTTSRFPAAVAHPVHGEPQSLADIHPLLREEYRDRFPDEDDSDVTPTPTVVGDEKKTSEGPAGSGPAAKDSVRK